MSTAIVIDTLANELGASAAARKKWRQRGVPYRWRIPIMQLAASRGVGLANEDFDSVGERRKKDAA